MISVGGVFRGNQGTASECSRYLHFGGEGVTRALGVACLLLLFALLSLPCLFVPSSAYAENLVVTQGEYEQFWFDNPSNTRGLIQKRLDEAKKASGTITVEVKKGTYELKDALQIRSNTHLILDDGVVLRRTNLSKGLIYNHGRTSDNKSWKTARGYSLTKNIVIEGKGSVLIDGGDTSKCGPNDTSDLMRFDHADGVTVKGLTFRNVYGGHHLEFVGVKNGTISNCSFSGFRRLAGHENDRDYGREAVQLDSCWADGTEGIRDVTTASGLSEWAGGTYLDGTNCQNCTVSGCRFTNVPSAIGQHHWTNDLRYKNSSGITIKNNIVSGSRSDKMLRYGITVAGMNNVTVTGNQVTGSFHRGILAYHSKGLRISGNRIDGAYVGVYTQSKVSSASIESNSLKNIGDIGVYVSKDGSLSGVSRNNISNVKNYGVCVGSDARVSWVASNTISKASYGVVVSGKSVVKSVSGDRVDRASKAAVYTGGKAKLASIKSNTVTKAKKYGVRLTSKAKKATVSKNKIQVHKKKYGISKAKKVKAKASHNKIRKW